MSVEEILAACRRLDGAKSGASPPAPAAKTEEAPPAPAAKPKPAAPAPAKPAAAPAGKSAKEMSVADILAAARGEKSGGAAQPAAPKKEAAAGEAAPAAKSAAPAKKPGEMNVADILAAARGQKPAAATPTEAPSTKPAPAAKPKPAAAPAAKEGAKKPAAAATAVALDTQSILAAARKGDKRGPISKEEAKAKTAVAEKTAAKPGKTKLQPPPMPEKPAYAVRPEPRIVTPAAETRRSFFGSFMGVFLGSSLAVGFTTLTLTNLLWLLGLARFMFPNILTEPPTKFKVGFPGDYAPGQVETKFIPQFGVWIVNYQYEGQPMIYALRSVCTHLGCTPNWLDAEQKFKCPCHGSGFYKDGINFEGPAPRPLERYAIRLADDGQLEVDKSQLFHEELGAWANPASYVPV